MRSSGSVVVTGLCGSGPADPLTSVHDGSSPAGRVNLDGCAERTERKLADRLFFHIKTTRVRGGCDEPVVPRRSRRDLPVLCGRRRRVLHALRDGRPLLVEAQREDKWTALDRDAPRSHVESRGFIGSRSTTRSPARHVTSNPVDAPVSCAAVTVP